MQGKTKRDRRSMLSQFRDSLSLACNGRPIYYDVTPSVSGAYHPAPFKVDVGAARHSGEQEFLDYVIVVDPFH